MTSGKECPMKHELLIQAIGQLDDALIEEAHMSRRRNLTLLPRISALAACFVLIFAGAWFALRSGGGGLRMDGTDLLAMGSGYAEFSLAPATQQRSATGIQIPLDVDVDGGTVKLSAGTETTLLLGEQSAGEWTLAENARIYWCIVPESLDAFQLAVTRDGETAVITASVSPDADSLILTVSR